MTEVLVRTGELPAAEVGQRFYDLYHTGDTAEVLAKRSIHGIGARYGKSPDEAIANVETGQNKADPLHYMIVDVEGDGEIYGWASSYLSLPLGKSRLPLPGAIARGDKGPRIPVVYTTYPYAMPNIQAAVVAGREDLLFPAYNELARLNAPRPGLAKISGVVIKHAWTLEANPKLHRQHRAQAAAREAITAAGLMSVANGRFDDIEASRRPIPRSTLYVLPNGPSRSVLGVLTELRTGRPSFWSRMDAADDEEMGRNPIHP